MAPFLRQSDSAKIRGPSQNLDMIDHEEEEGSDDQRSKRPRRVCAHPDYGKSAWGMMLADDVSLNGESWVPGDPSV